MKRVTFSKQALRTLTRLPTNTARLIRAKIDQYAANPADHANNVKRLKGGSGAFRLRVGDWRVIFDVHGEVIAVISVASRGGVYD